MATEHYPYSLRALLAVPRRLLHPPPAAVRIGRVRSMSLTPLFEVQLADVLDGRHLPPLGLKDFEEYLLFVEHSPENLYFIQWLRGYSRQYSAWAQTGAAVSPQLAFSWSRAKHTFLTPDASLRLNLPVSILDGLVSPPADASTTPAPCSPPQSTGLPHPYHPSPKTLSNLEREVEDMLRESLRRFVTGSCGNSGRARGLFGIVLGLITMAVALAPVLVSVLGGRGRAVRVAAIPIFWLGAWITIMSLHGVCIVIFLFGDARQLYSYELACPKITRPVPKPTDNHAVSQEPQHDTKSEKDSHLPDTLYVDLERGHGDGSAPVPENKPVPRSLSAASSVSRLGRDGDSCELSDTSSPPRPTSSQQVQPPSSLTSWTFDFDALPVTSTAMIMDKRSKTSGDKGIPMFGPLARVLSPVVTRAQWEIVVRSALLAMLVAAILGAVCLAIPARER